MTERTEVEKNVRLLIASDILYRPLKSLGEKGVRRIEKTAKNISALLKDGSETGERIFAKIEVKSEEEKARTLNKGIEEFCKKYPKEGKILTGLIDEKRSQRNKYLTYGLMPDFKLGEEDYLSVMRDIGFERREASSIYPHVIAYSERLGKAYEQSERTILLK
jgi:CRISPR/Cas system-associated protein endoribonuclease Cas2